MSRIKLLSFALVASVLCARAYALPAKNHSRLPPITTKQVAPHIWYLRGAGGNMTALIGNDGTLLVDAEFGFMAPAILDKLKALGDGAPRFVVNTHYHQDHTGGNGAMRAAGAMIIAQANVRTRLAEVQRAPFGKSTPRPIPKAKWPTITFRDRLTLYLDGETVRIVHLPPAHTDGDSVVIFQPANVIATGDIYFSGGYPVIDVDTGGSIGGVIADINRLLPRINSRTVVIPGHGPVADKAALVRYRDMLVAARDAVRKLVDGGKTLTEIQAAHPTASFDKQWGSTKHGVGAHRFVAEIYYSLRPHFPGT
jgi:glyoxylase-like metal-dependent hydrolase (beta-lactamase superfamily II)